jgi:hypothetical protein
MMQALFSVTHVSDIEHDICARYCRLLAFVKRVHVLIQTKSQVIRPSLLLRGIS